MTRWIVDGMNVIGSRPTGWWHDRPGAMQQLVHELEVLDDPVTVVFDGRPFDVQDAGDIDVRFASRSGRNAADDDIAELVAGAADPGELTVVTSDRELVARVRGHGVRGRWGRSSSASDLTMGDPRYSTALLDWLACAAGGRDQPAARAARAYGDPVVLAGTSGHVLDFDDTYLPGIAHLSAPTAPAALVVAAELGLTVGAALDAFARGFEAMAALARASHPGLYDNGWHPTAVCGGVGAAVAAATLLDAPEPDAVAIALLRASGTRAAFGSDGKSIQVGLAAASGVAAARLAKEGARVPLDKAAAGFEQATGGRYAEPAPDTLAVADNWIKAWPCCLQTHGAIEAADRLNGNAPDDLTVTVHPVSLQAAALGPEPADGLQAKFSIPYLTAYTLLHGPPVVESFERVDDAAVERAQERSRSSPIARCSSPSSCSAAAGASELVRVKAALGSPQQPMDAGALRAKVEGLRGPGARGRAGRSPVARRRAARPRRHRDVDAQTLKDRRNLPNLCMGANVFG